MATKPQSIISDVIKMTAAALSNNNKTSTNTSANSKSPSVVTGSTSGFVKDGSLIPTNYSAYRSDYNRKYQVYKSKDGNQFYVFDTSGNLYALDKTISDSLTKSKDLKSGSKITANTSIDIGKNNISKIVDYKGVGVKTEADVEDEGQATYGGSYTPVDPVKTTFTEKDVEKIVQDALENAKPEKWTAEQIADYHDVYDYDRDYLLNRYNEDTNDFYDAAIANQQKELNKYDAATQNNFGRTMYDYVRSYDNMAATTSNKAKLAANLLNTYLAQDQINSQYGNEMYQSLVNYENQRQAELANNDYLAEQRYNTIGNWLRQYSTDYYNSDITDYVNSTKAYGEENAARRAIAAEQATSAATKYAGLANASAINAGAQGKSNYDTLYEIYNAVGGQKYADNVMNNLYKTNSNVKIGG